MMILVLLLAWLFLNEIHCEVWIGSFDLSTVTHASTQAVIHYLGSFNFLASDSESGLLYFNFRIQGPESTKTLNVLPEPSETHAGTRAKRGNMAPPHVKELQRLSRLALVGCARNQRSSWALSHACYSAASRKYNLPSGQSSSSSSSSATSSLRSSTFYTGSDQCGFYHPLYPARYSGSTQPGYSDPLDSFNLIRSVEYSGLLDFYVIDCATSLSHSPVSYIPTSYLAGSGDSDSPDDTVTDPLLAKPRYGSDDGSSSMRRKREEEKPRSRVEAEEGMRKRHVAVQVHSASPAYEFNYTIECLNPGDEQLSGGDLPLPVARTLLTALYAAVAIGLARGIFLHRSKQAVSLHMALLAITMIKFLSNLLQWLVLHQLSSSGMLDTGLLTFANVFDSLARGSANFLLILLCSGWAFAAIRVPTSKWLGFLALVMGMTLASALRFIFPLSSLISVAISVIECILAACFMWWLYVSLSISIHRARAWVPRTRRVPVSELENEGNNEREGNADEAEVQMNEISSEDEEDAVSDEADDEEELAAGLLASVAATSARRSNSQPSRVGGGGDEQQVLNEPAPNLHHAESEEVIESINTISQAINNEECEEEESFEGQEEEEETNDEYEYEEEEEEEEEEAVIWVEANPDDRVRVEYVEELFLQLRATVYAGVSSVCILFAISLVLSFYAQVLTWINEICRELIDWSVIAYVCYTFRFKSAPESAFVFKWPVFSIV